MNALSRLPIAALVFLSACAPAVIQADLTTPILAPGQVWVMSADPAKGQPTPLPDTLTVGKPSRIGSASVGFTGDIQSAGVTTTSDAFYYDPVDSDPEFIVAARAEITTGLTSVRGCTVRNPVNQLNTPQTGIYQIGSDPTVITGNPAVKTYIDTGTLGGQRSCTLTRIK